MLEGSSGTTDDLTGRRECMQKPHVQQPAVNSKYVVSLAGHCIFFPANTQFASNEDKSSWRPFSLSPQSEEETPFSLFISASLRCGHLLQILHLRSVSLFLLLLFFYSIVSFVRSSFLRLD